MNRWIITVLSAVLAFSLAGTASAAAKPPAIRVTLEGKALSFQTPPTIVGGKTFVEFRTLFKALGYKVDYVASTKTVKAQSAARKLEMKVGSSTALVNGAKVPVNGDLKLIGGRTMVGVRFIATLSGKKVDWNAQGRTVVIANPGPTAAEERVAVMGVLDKLTQAESAGDADAYMSQFSPDAESRAEVEAGIREQFSRVQIETKYVSKKLTSLTATQAVVTTTEEIRKSGGTAFFADRRDEYEYNLRKDAKGQWKIHVITQLNSEVLNADDLWKQEVQAPAEDKQAIEGLMNAQAQAINDKNFDAYGATYAQGTPGAAEEVADLKNMKAEMAVKVERTAIVEYSPEHAVLLASLTLEVKQDGQTQSGRSIIAIPAMKQDGKWLFVDTGEALLSENL